MNTMGLGIFSSALSIFIFAFVQMGAELSDVTIGVVLGSLIAGTIQLIKDQIE